MAYVLAVMAAFANALTSVLQRMGVESAPADTNLKFSLIAYAIRRTVWIAGFLVLIAAFLLQFLALHFGRLTTVQPILTLGAALPRRHPGDLVPPAPHLEGVDRCQCMAAGGLAAFLALSAPSGGNETPDLEDWGIVSFAVIAGCSLVGPAHPGGVTGVAGRVVRHRRGHRLRLHRRAHQDR